MKPGTTFNATQWTDILRGAPLAPETLLEWRLQPPRVVTQEAVDAGLTRESYPRWDAESTIPVATVARQWSVTPETIRNRARRWGIPLYSQPVGGVTRTGLTVLTMAGYRALCARSLQPLEAGVRRRGAAMARGAVSA